MGNATYPAIQIVYAAWDRDFITSPMRFLSAPKSFMKPAPFLTFIPTAGGTAKAVLSRHSDVPRSKSASIFVVSTPQQL